MKHIKIAGAVVLYQPTDEDIANISSYIKDIDHLYVMDNSTNENIKRLPKSKKIEYIFNHQNLGIAAPLNLAAQKAREAGYTWLLTMDQDTFFPSGILATMKERIATMDTEDIGIVTPWHKTRLKVEKPKESISYQSKLLSASYRHCRWNQNNTHLFSQSVLAPVSAGLSDQE